MQQSLDENKLFREILSSTKKIAMVGASSVKKDVNLKEIKRKPSIIVMKYLQEFGYHVIPVNPSSGGKKILGEIAVSKLYDIKDSVDLVNVFRPSNETPEIAKQAVKIGAKVLWLQFGIVNNEARDIAEAGNVIYVANRCIKQEYQRLFLKINPVFPVLL